MKGEVQPFHRKRVRELSYLRASTEIYFLWGIKGWKFDRDAFRLTPVYLDGSTGPVLELREMYEHFRNERAKFDDLVRSSENGHAIYSKHPQCLFTDQRRARYSYRRLADCEAIKPISLRSIP